MVEFIVWSIRLWLVGYREKVKDRERRLTDKYMTYGWPWRWLRDFVDQVASPFDPRLGYRRLFVRRLLWRLAHPLPVLRLNSLRWSLVILNGVLPYTGPGRFEFADPAYQLKAEWLDAHSEWAARTTGSTEWGMWYALFTQIAVPWSRSPETWLMRVDHHGFVGVERYWDDGEATDDFEAFDSSYVNDPENVDEYGGPDDSAPWTNREGQPEFNGAFGG